MSKKTLIVGGAGYIGGKVTDLMDAMGRRVVVSDNLLYEDRYTKQIDFRYEDAESLNYQEINKRFCCIVWLAGIVGDAACRVNTDRTKIVNVDAVKRLVDSFSGHIIFTSTCSVYGENDQMCVEETRVNPLSLYAETKYEAEQYILRNRKDVASVFRLGTVFGAGDSHARPRFDLILNNMVREAVIRKRVTIGNQTQWRPIVHVSDVARMIYRAVQTPFFGLYNLVGNNVTVSQLANLVASLLDAEVVIEDGQFEDARSYQADSQKLKNAIKYIPHKSIQEGIQEIAVEIRTGRIPNPYSISYDNAAFLRTIWK